MSRKTEEDYVAVLQSLKDRLVDPVVTHFVVDFEIGKYIYIDIYNVRKTSQHQSYGSLRYNNTIQVK